MLKRIIALTTTLCLFIVVFPAIVSAGAFTEQPLSGTGSFVTGTWVRGGAYADAVQTYSATTEVSAGAADDDIRATYYRINYTTLALTKTEDGTAVGWGSAAANKYDIYGGVISAKLRVCVAETDGDTIRKVDVFPTSVAMENGLMKYNLTPEMNNASGQIRNAPLIGTMTIDKTVDKWYEVDVTDYIRDYYGVVGPYITQYGAGTPSGNAAFRLRGNTEAGGLVKFYSPSNADSTKRPQLVVTWDKPSVASELKFQKMTIAKKDGAYNVKLSASNTTTAAASRTSVLAFYNSAKKLLKVVPQTVTVNPGAALSGAVVNTYGDVAGATTVKACLWKGVASDITPLIAKAERAASAVDAPTLSAFEVMRGTLALDSYSGPAQSTAENVGTGGTNGWRSGTAGTNLGMYVYADNGAAADAHYIQFTFNASAAGDYKVTVYSNNAASRGIYDVAVNGSAVGTFNGADPTSGSQAKALNSAALTAGTNTIRFTRSGGAGTAQYLCLEKVVFTPVD
jgi:hypothetical protein